MQTHFASDQIPFLLIPIYHNFVNLAASASAVAGNPQPNFDSNGFDNFGENIGFGGAGGVNAAAYANTGFGDGNPAGFDGNANSASSQNSGFQESQSSHAASSSSSAAASTASHSQSTSVSGLQQSASRSGRLLFNNDIKNNKNRNGNIVDVPPPSLPFSSPLTNTK